ncbi:Rrf2 family transcriptional regulator [Ramlibacter sp.]|uniref:RrF2 family transcriptional regulator n=1 Tax=Ramlibacter sp. TaxID=1917967 RepID=UPI002CA27E81|nr:Rrf2 family transcriptional regulator [Ramlibacter sp.]HWI83098.1 Rrf2 family transcriptional regulator [Ramlibacter sp.]
MRLAEYTDYTLRVLMYCASNPDRLITISEMAQAYELSKNHLMKIVSDLARQGLIETTRGRGGGVRLVKAPSEIRIGDVVRASETDFRLVECFDESTNTCMIANSCRMKRLFGKALMAYFQELDGATLADIVAPAPRRAGAPAGRGGAVIPIRAAARAPATRRRGSRVGS